MRTLAWLLVLAALRTAHADDEWSQGVSADKQKAAQVLYEDGNQLAAQEAYPGAVEKFKAALALWDHPLIRLNLAIAEIQLDHLLEAADDLDAALRFGRTPFKHDEDYKQALNYRKLVQGRVGILEISCAQDRTSIVLDGKPWFDCPRTQSKRLLAGEHVIVGDGKGYMTVSRRVFVAGGAIARDKLELVRFDAAVTLHYRWPRWQPWTVVGAGLAVGLGGLGVWYAGDRAMHRFDLSFAEICNPSCSENLGANPVEQQLARDRDRAQLEGNLGVGFMIAGGAIAAAGAVWLVLDRPERVLPKLEVAPTHGGVATSATWRF